MDICVMLMSYFHFIQSMHYKITTAQNSYIIFHFYLYILYIIFIQYIHMPCIYNKQYECTKEANKKKKKVAVTDSKLYLMFSQMEEKDTERTANQRNEYKTFSFAYIFISITRSLTDFSLFYSMFLFIFILFIHKLVWI